MAISSSRMSKTLQRMLVRTQALVESGVIEQPKWLDAVRRNPPEPLVKGHRPKALTFPEDPLIQSYMARHPEAKLVPISLSGDQPAPARAFAMRQLQLIQGGMSKRRAREQVEAEMAAEREALLEGGEEALGEGSALAATQQAEEDALQAAMAEPSGGGRQRMPRNSMLAY